MPEQIRENELPLNQKAKQALRTMKVSPDPGGLYLLQLVQECVDRGYIEFQMSSPHAKGILLENLENLYTCKHAEVMRVFQENNLGDPVELVPPGPVNPKQLACEALQQLHSRLTASLPGYPVASPRD